MTAPHFHGRVVIAVDLYDPSTLAAVHEKGSAFCAGVALEYGVEPEVSILWPHTHGEHDDEDNDHVPDRP